jgi:hypothetical protein
VFTRKDYIPRLITFLCRLYNTRSIRTRLGVELGSGESVFSFFESSLSLNVFFLSLSLSLCSAVTVNAFVAGYVTGFDRVSTNLLTVSSERNEE